MNALDNSPCSCIAQHRGDMLVWAFIYADGSKSLWELHQLPCTSKYYVWKYNGSPTYICYIGKYCATIILPLQTIGYNL